MPSGLFPFAQYWWLYLAFTGVVTVLLTVDLTLHRKASVVTVSDYGAHAVRSGRSHMLAGAPQGP